LRRHGAAEGTFALAVSLLVCNVVEALFAQLA
jgi:hypothetical protein